MSRCIYCGFALRSGEKFCPKCGFSQQNNISAADRLNSLFEAAKRKQAAKTIPPPAKGVPPAPPSSSISGNFKKSQPPAASKFDRPVSVSAKKTVKAGTPRTLADIYEYYGSANKTGKSGGAQTLTADDIVIGSADYTGGNTRTPAQMREANRQADNVTESEASRTGRVYEINTTAEELSAAASAVGVGRVYEINMPAEETSGVSIEELSGKIDRLSLRLSDLANSLNRIERKIEDMSVSLRRSEIKKATESGNALTRDDVDAMLSFMRLIAANQLLNL